MHDPLTDDQRDCVEANMGLVRKFCWRYRHDRRYEDLRSAAFIGLCYAVQQHDPAIAKLSTYAWRLMANEVREEMSRLDMIRLAPKMHCKGMETRYLPETVALAERAKKARKIAWTDEEAVDVLAIDHGEEYHDYAELHRQLDALKIGDRHAVVEMVVRERTQQSVGEEMGVTKERARQLKVRGLGVLRERLNRLERLGAL